MAISKTSRKAERSLGCLVLFALPFAAVGVGMAVWCAYIVMQHAAMRSWIEVPATIKSAELKTSRGDDGNTYKAIATYEYEFAGRKYRGERVSVGSGSDNIGNFQRDAYNELKQHLDGRKPFRCYVDPQRPSESVLYRKIRGEMISFNTAFATVFGSVGIGLMMGSIAASRLTPPWKPDFASSDRPWEARSDWATGQIQPSGRTIVPALITVAITWNVASLPLLISLREILLQRDSNWMLLSLLFPLVGGALIALLIYEVLRNRKFGQSVMQLANTPGVIGGQLAGVVSIASPVQAMDGFRVMLSCIEEQESGDSTREVVLWQDERVLMDPMRDEVTGAMAVPVLFAIPFESAETSLPDSNRKVEWRLDVSARTTGIDYKSRFELPVFKTPDSRADFVLDKGLSTDYAAPPSNDFLLGEAGIFKEPLAGGGVRLVFPAARNWGNAIGLTLFLAIWTVAIAVMRRLGAPLIFPIVFSLFELMIVWIVLDLWFYRSVVEVTRGELTIRGGLLGIGKRRTLAADEVKQFSSTEYMSSGTQTWNSIVVVPHTGRKRTIAKGIRSKLALDAIIDELNTAIGRNKDADVRK